MEFRVYTDIYSKMSFDEQQDTLLRLLGTAKMNGPRLVESGIVTSEMLDSLTPHESQKATMEKIRQSYSTFDVISNEWIVFNYFSAKQINHRTAPGALYTIGLYPHKDSETYDSTTLLTIGYNKRRGLVCLVANAGRIGKTQFDEFVEDLANAVQSSGVPTSLSFEEEQIKKLASIYIDDKFSIASSTVDVASSKITISHVLNIFHDQEIQDADRYLGIEERIQSGNWNSLAFHVTNPEYYLYVSKCRPSSLNIVPNSRDKLARKDAIEIMEHIVSRIVRISDFSTYQSIIN
ncbi:MAG: hypothetical protein ACFFEV_00285 [Candidatus Thorarchaeota archaeon]